MRDDDCVMRNRMIFGHAYLRWKFLENFKLKDWEDNQREVKNAQFSYVRQKRNIPMKQNTQNENSILTIRNVRDYTRA